MSVPQKWKYEVPQKWKKVFIWYMVLIEISQEGEASFPQKWEKCIYLVKGNNLRFPRKWKRVPGKWKWYLTGRRLFFKGKNIYHRSCRFMLEEQTFLIRELKIRLVTKSHVISQEGET